MHILLFDDRESRLNIEYLLNLASIHASHQIN